MLLTDGVPICRIVSVSSARRMSSTRSMPSWPKADRPQMYGRPMPTPRAPEASALKTSVPRRKPPSTKHRDAAADRLDDFRQAVDRRAQRFAGAAAVIGHDDAVDAVLHGQPRVLARCRSLQHQLHPVSFFSRSTYAHVAFGGLNRPSRPSYIGRWMRHAGRVLRVAGHAVARVLARESRRRLRVPAGEQIDRPDEHGTSRVFDALDQLLRLVPLQRHVQLIPRRRAERPSTTSSTAYVVTDDSIIVASSREPLGRWPARPRHETRAARRPGRRRSASPTSRRTPRP